jgi:hypothetical protein
MHVKTQTPTTNAHTLFWSAFSALLYPFPPFFTTVLSTYIMFMLSVVCAMLLPRYGLMHARFYASRVLVELSIYQKSNKAADFIKAERKGKVKNNFCMLEVEWEKEKKGKEKGKVKVKEKEKDNRKEKKGEKDEHKVEKKNEWSIVIVSFLGNLFLLTYFYFT